jgi:hypothetical protein
LTKKKGLQRVGERERENEEVTRNKDCKEFDFDHVG